MKNNMKYNKAYNYNKQKKIDYFFFLNLKIIEIIGLINLMDVLKKNYYPTILKKKISLISIDIEVSAFCDLACPFCFREAIVHPIK